MFDVYWTGTETDAIRYFFVHPKDENAILIYIIENSLRKLLVEKKSWKMYFKLLRGQYTKSILLLSFYGICHVTIYGSDYTIILFDHLRKTIFHVIREKHRKAQRTFTMLSI